MDRQSPTPSVGRCSACCPRGSLRAYLDRERGTCRTREEGSGTEQLQLPHNRLVLARLTAHTHTRTDEDSVQRVDTRTHTQREKKKERERQVKKEKTKEENKEGESERESRETPDFQR
jgi:hypothetical protein